MDETDKYDDPELEAQWLAEQRAKVQKYFQVEGVLHRGVAAEPQWFWPPYASVWTIESMEAPGTVGWWAISGDLPTDYLSGRDATDARTALDAFADRWREASAYMLRGEPHPTVTYGPPGEWKELGGVLSSLAEIIKSWTGSDELWQESTD